MAFIDLNSSFIDHIVKILQSIQEHGPAALFDLLLGIIVIRLFVRGTRLLLKATQIQTGMRYVITSLTESFLWILLTITILQELGLNNIIFFFTGSIAAIGIAMAAGGSTLVSDVVAAIFLARDGDFNIGDEVIAGEPSVQGIIERMDSRRTRIRDAEGNLHILPNSLVERKEWVVVHRRTEIPAITRAAKAAKSALENMPISKVRKARTRKNDQ